MHSVSTLKGDNLPHLDALAVSSIRGLDNAITCMRSANQRPVVEPVATRLIHNVSFPTKHQNETWYVLFQQGVIYDTAIRLKFAQVWRHFTTA